jgi:hypothetical protein
LLILVSAAWPRASARPQAGVERGRGPAEPRQPHRAAARASESLGDHPRGAARTVLSIAAGDTARDEKTEHGRRVVKGGKIAANRARVLLSTMINLVETWDYRPRNSNPSGGAKRFLKENPATIAASGSCS